MTVRTPIESRTRSVPVWALAFTVVVLVIGGVYAGGNLSGENPPIIGDRASTPAARRSRS